MQQGYQQQFQQIAMQIMDCRTWQDWTDVYKRLVRWELELSATDSQMTEMLDMQKKEANIGFAKYIKKNYMDWMSLPTTPSKGKDSDVPMLHQSYLKTECSPC